MGVSSTAQSQIYILVLPVNPSQVALSRMVMGTRRAKAVTSTGLIWHFMSRNCSVLGSPKHNRILKATLIKTDALAAFSCTSLLQSRGQVLLVNPVPTFLVISLVVDMIHCTTGQLSIIQLQIKLVAMFTINLKIPVNAGVDRWQKGTHSMTTNQEEV